MWKLLEIQKEGFKNAEMLEKSLPEKSSGKTRVLTSWKEPKKVQNMNILRQNWTFFHKLERNEI